MNCNTELHESMNESGEMVCPFCNEKLDTSKKPQDCLVKYYSCCDSQNIINNSGMIVCRCCGIVQGYETTREYVDVYENKHKMKRRSVYHRKYHINDILTDISIKYKITFSVNQKNKIMKIFSEIGKILPQINGERKRMISVNFILAKILKMMKLPHSYVKITKSKRTKTTYQYHWDQIILLIGDKINRIINE